MKYLKTLVGAAALAVASFNVSAAPITVGGVTWDPDSIIDFRAQFDLVQTFNGSPTVAGTELFGFGIVRSINGTNESVFCTSCELTFGFGGFLTDGAGGFQQGKGFLRIYSDTNKDYIFSADANGMNSATATNGNLWLELLAKDITFISDSPNPSNPYVAGVLRVSWLLGDVSAAAYGNFIPGAINGSDAFSSADSALVIGNLFDGSGVVRASSIPEPASIALLGLGLLGLVGGRRFKKA